MVGERQVQGNNSVYGKRELVPGMQREEQGVGTSLAQNYSRKSGDSYRAV